MQSRPLERKADMLVTVVFITASFATPENVGTDPQSLLWLLPLVAAIAIVYKATKLPTITVGNFIKEAALLFGSIIVFMLIVAFALYAVARLITE